MIVGWVSCDYFPQKYSDKISDLPTQKHGIITIFSSNLTGKNESLFGHLIVLFSVFFNGIVSLNHPYL